MNTTKITTAVALLLCASVSQAGVINGNFSAGSSGWASGGNVLFDGSTARLIDGTPHSLLYQAIQVTPGANYIYQFDWYAVLGGSTFIPDSFIPSLYFINDISQFSLSSVPVYDAVIQLGRVDSPFNAGGNYVFSFTTPYQYVIPVFELLDFNPARDSFVVLDNVRLIDPQAPIVPEPATLALVGCGLAGMALRRRKS